MKNKIALRLSLYFALVLIIFAIIIGGTFYVLFKNHTVELHKTELETRAETIAENVSDVMVGTQTQDTYGHGMGMGMMRHGGMQGRMPGGLANYLSIATEISGDDIWVVDRDNNLVTSGMHGHGMMQRNFEYSDLPENADTLIRQAMNGETVFSEGLSDLLLEPTLTVVVPVRDGSDTIGVVMLHSPVYGTTEAVFEGWKILTISIVIALVLSILLSIWLSKSFTDPIVSKEAIDALKMEDERREFIANISHELKTPVTVIRGSLEALVDEVVTDPVQVDEYHKQLLNETVFLQRLVGDLLELSKLQNKEFKIEKERVSADTILSDVVRSISPVAKNKNIEIEIKSDGDYIFLGDYGRLRQMFFIILDNAVKFSDYSGKVEIIKAGNKISIKDYGIGISAEELPYVFDRFHKSRSEDNKSGTGLGLSIAKQIAQRHEIEIDVASEEGKGTVFTFSLPESGNVAQI